MLDILTSNYYSGLFAKTGIDDIGFFDWLSLQIAKRLQYENTTWSEHMTFEWYKWDVWSWDTDVDLATITDIETIEDCTEITYLARVGIFLWIEVPGMTDESRERLITEIDDDEIVKIVQSLYQGLDIESIWNFYIPWYWHIAIQQDTSEHVQKALDSNIAQQFDSLAWLKVHDPEDILNTIKT